MRTIVDLTDEQVKRLRLFCEREKISRAEAVRRGIDILLSQPDEDEAKFLAALDRAFGSWKGHGIDSVEYQRQLRAEWERDDR